MAIRHKANIITCNIKKLIKHEFNNLTLNQQKALYLDLERVYFRFIDMLQETENER